MSDADDLKARKELNLFERIHKISKDCEYIQKEAKKVNGQYKPLNRNAVIARVVPLLHKWGVCLVPSECLKSEIKEVATKDSKGLVGAIVQGYKVVNVDAPEQVFTFSIAASGFDTLDKGFGKALTYSEKQAMVNLFHIETGDDEDSPYKRETPSPDDVEKISLQEQSELRELGKKISVDEKIIARSAGPDYDKLSDIPKSNFAAIKERMSKRLEQLNAK